jgi:hypothetical protein
MSLSPSVQENLDEAKSFIRSALRNAATNEKSYVTKQIADILYAIDGLEKTEMLMDKIENRKSGDSGIFGAFFNDM